VNWINPKTVSSLALLTIITGCANQETILPPAEREMIDIYREAMNQVEGPTALAFDPATICSSLELEEPPEECQKKLEAHAQAVYRQLEEVKPEQPLEYVEYTRTALRELDSLFPRHDNPDMVIYVYPHLATRTRAPIPGYTTVIPLYERIEYRLPGESILMMPESATPEAAAGDTQ
jgi:conjugative transfer region lipoprotein (TIGR03751 family)